MWLKPSICKRDRYGCIEKKFLSKKSRCQQQQLRFFWALLLQANRLQYKNDFNFGRFTKSISYMQSKMKSFAKVIKLKPNVIMISVDLIDACFSVPLNLEHQKYLFFFLFFFLRIISIHLFVQWLWSSIEDLHKTKVPLSYLRSMGLAQWTMWMTHICKIPTSHAFTVSWVPLTQSEFWV